MKRVPSISVLFVLVLLFAGCETDVTDERQAEVARIGETVMPFDLERTTHVFEKTTNGGVQQVISDDEDVEQVGLIRSHLSEVSERFSAGDFHDPTQIHGEMMPGLHALKMGADRMSITYSEIANGGQITYVTDDEVLITAVHDWFDAQVSDHGAHAQHNH
ncbi:MAG: aspartate carbamoyltransferase [Rhodothermales bacterium]